MKKVNALARRDDVIFPGFIFAEIDAEKYFLKTKFDL